MQLNCNKEIRFFAVKNLHPNRCTPVERKVNKLPTDNCLLLKKMFIHLANHIAKKTLGLSGFKEQIPNLFSDAFPLNVFASEQTHQIESNGEKSLQLRRLHHFVRKAIQQQIPISLDVDSAHLNQMLA